MLKYFLDVKVTRSNQVILLSQRKYVLNMLSKTGKLGVKPCSTPMAPNVQLTKKELYFFIDHQQPIYIQDNPKPNRK